MAKHIDLQYSYDTHSCETCGSSYSTGLKVEVDGAVVYEIPASAHCFGGPSFDGDETLAIIGEILGIKITQEGQPIHISYYDYKDGFI